MAYFNGFPATYPQVYPQFMYQPPAQPQQQMTAPTIRAEIVQVDDETAAGNYPVGAGASVMMIAKDDSAIFVKSALQNGQTTLDVYERRPPAPPAPVFDPAEYVRKDEIEQYIANAFTSRKSAKLAEEE